MYLTLTIPRVMLFEAFLSFLGLTLLALNFLGDGLRDALDPRMKNR